MFGMGITEILFIAVIAIIFLGPDHLPKAMIETAKFIKSLKKTLTDAKETIEKEVNISELKNEALEYKKMVENGVDEFTKVGDLDLEETDKPIAKKSEKDQDEPKKEVPKITEKDA